MLKKASFVLAALLLIGLVLEGVSAAWLALAGLDTDMVRLGLEDRAGRQGGAASSMAQAGRLLRQGYVLHPYFGFVYDARDSGAVNAQGFIGPNLLDHGAPGDFNVVITGGSVAANFFAMGWLPLRDALAALPGAAGRTVNVFCLAIPGYKQPQQLFTLSYFLARGAKIDLVVNIDGFNDVVLPVHDLTPAGISPFFPMFWGELTDTFADAKARGLLGRMALWDGLSRGLAEVLAPLSFSRTVLLTWHLGEVVCRRREEAAASALRERAVAKRPLPAGVAPEESPETVLTRAADLWMRSSLAMAELARGFGFGYIHVLQPNQYPEGAKPLSAGEKAKAVSPDPTFGDMVRRGYKILSARGAQLREAGVIFDDATCLFADCTEDLYFDTCCHFNEAGNNRLVARVAALADQALAPAPAATAQTAVPAAP